VNEGAPGNIPGASGDIAAHGRSPSFTSPAHRKYDRAWMSAADVQVVQRFRDALAAADTESAVALLVPDVEWVHPKGTMHGVDEVRQGWLGSAVSTSGPENLDVQFDPGQLEDLGDGRVGATNRQTYWWRESGELAYEKSARIEYLVRDGKIARYEARVLDE
jgi:ketosteroid isomerase-like protein